MTLTDVLAVAATAWGLLMGVAPALQIRRMFQTQSSRDVSLGYLALLTPGFVLWLGYGIAIGNAPVMITNTVSLTFMLITIGIAWSFRRRDGSGSPTVETRPSTKGVATADGDEAAVAG